MVHESIYSIISFSAMNIIKIELGKKMNYSLVCCIRRNVCNYWW
jgi:hypothetical protein